MCYVGDDCLPCDNCKSTKYGGKLSKQIFTGVKLKDCLNSSQEIPLCIIFDDNRI